MWWMHECVCMCVRIYGPLALCWRLRLHRRSRTIHLTHTYVHRRRLRCGVVDVVLQVNPVTLAGVQVGYICVSAHVPESLPHKQTYLNASSAAQNTVDERICRRRRSPHVCYSILIEHSLDVLAVLLPVELPASSSVPVRDTRDYE